jgi:threonine aldolase
MMIRMNNDYHRAAHPEVLRAVEDTAMNDYPGYGNDEWCSKAADLIRSLTKCPQAAVHFFPGATQANFVVISALLNTTQSIIAAQTGHINAHECASIENTGHKILALQQNNGKITAAQIEKEAAAYYDSGEAEFLTEPKLVYVSFTTEQGTLYSLQELKDISAVCRKYGMYLFVDGARLGYGLESCRNDVSLEDLAELTDVFYIGGTKCGAFFGEAVILCNPAIQKRFKSVMKQNGAVLAKGWLLGAQFYALLKDGLYFRLAKQADEYAMQIRNAFEKKGYTFFSDSYSNQQFVNMSDKQAEAFAEKFIYEVDHRVDDTHVCVRFCTSWDTDEKETRELIHSIESI